MAAFLAARLPPALKQPGGHDEDAYAIPAITIAGNGLPRVPTIATDDPDSVFYRSREIWLANPPLFFYAGALTHLLGPPGNPGVRLASLASGVAAILLVFAIGRRLWGTESGLWAAGIYSISRHLYFPALQARPDMLCTALALAAVAALLAWESSGQRRDLFTSGVCLGLAGLTHPFAIVPAMQLGAWTLVRRAPARRRVSSAACLTLAALLAFSVFLALIVPFWDIFEVQFRNNILRQAGPGLADRLLSPWPALRAVLPEVIDRGGPWQSAAGAIGLTVMLLLAVRPSAFAERRVALLGWTGVALLVIAQGDHALQGYWSLPWAFFSLALAELVLRAVRMCGRPSARRMARATAVLALLALHTPGCGLRATFAYLRHWDDARYDAREFLANILHDIPPGARILAGREFVGDIFATGRPVLEAMYDPLWYDGTVFEYDSLILGRSGRTTDLAERCDGVLRREYGQVDDLFSGYARVYTPREVRPGAKPWPAPDANR